MSLLLFAVLGLATWRIATMLVNEHGPLYIFERLRYRAGLMRATGDPSFMVPVGEETFWTGLFSCVYCLSIWVGLIFAVLAWLWPSGVLWLALPFALSAVAVWFEDRRY